MQALSHSTSVSPKLVRAAGAVGAAAWVCLSLFDRAAWPRAGLLALVLSFSAASVAKPLRHLPRLILAPSRRVFVGTCALVASSVSYWLTQGWMGATPVVIDAGVYLMQARAMAHGHFGMPVPSPLQAYSLHFVLEGADQRLYGVFPPGWPLALVPFVWLGAPMLAGPALAALLIVAQAALGREMGRAAGDEAGGELATRVSLCLSLPSYARAFQTADLMSHGLVALLAAVAVTGAMRTASRDREAPNRRWGAAIGACVGWATAARLLDGLVIAAAVAGVLVWTKRGKGALGWAALGAAPFLVLLAVEQRWATGEWFLPTQTAYFRRTDWPPNCHGLGIGPGVGCTVEHAEAVARFGPDGYDLRAALATTHDRALALGEDLFGFSPLALLVFVPLACGASAVDAIGAAFVLAFTLSYGLFYYNGNAALYGARHLFPVAPFAWLLAARAAVLLPMFRGPWQRSEANRARGVAVALLLAVAAVCAYGPWKARGGQLAARQRPRADLRRALARRGLERGIVVSHDQTAVAAALDSWVNAPRLFVVDDGSGLLELRRTHPTWPVLLSVGSDDIGSAYVTRIPPGVLVELERTWPTFVRPSGLAVRRAPFAEASGETVLRLFHAHPGAEVAIPFEVAVAGDYVVHIDGVVGPDHGDYAFTLDGAALPDWHGYGDKASLRRGEPVEWTFRAGRHTLVARCIGREERSGGYDAELDDLVGEAR